MRVARTRIDRASWYARLELTRIQRDDLNEEQRKELLERLRESGRELEPEVSVISYLPTRMALDPGLLARIPSGTVIQIVRPNWDIRERIGTLLDVSHRGFVLKLNGRVMFRHLSMIDQKVLDIELATYLKAKLKDRSIGGVNLLEVSR